MELIQKSQIDVLIYMIRGKKVLLDADLAFLYGVTTKRLNQQVRRNQNRFPDDFMFELTDAEFQELKSNNATSGRHGGRRHRPLAFTEQGVAMLSSVLTSERAAIVNVAIMRTFVKLRTALTETPLVDRVSRLEKETAQTFKIVFQRLDTVERNIPILPHKRRKIGIKQD